MKSKLILASASPRRLQLLTNLGFVPDEVIPSDIDETPLKKENPEAYCKRIAAAKAHHIKNNFLQAKDAFVLSADTIAVVNNTILGKPKDRADAANIIMKMSGRSHRVYTAVCIISDKGEVREKLIETKVKFKNISEPELEKYLNIESWQGKAGAYGLQEDPGGFVIEIHGSFSSVIGLPLYETKNMLLGLGFRT
jgi:septum formation protein